MINATWIASALILTLLAVFMVMFVFEMGRAKGWRQGYTAGSADSARYHPTWEEDGDEEEQPR